MSAYSYNKDQHLRVGQAADYLAVSSKTLRRWGKSGKLVGSRTDGNQRYYTKEQLDHFLNFNQKKQKEFTIPYFKPLGSTTLSFDPALVIRSFPSVLFALTWSLLFVLTALFLLIGSNSLGLFRSDKVLSLIFTPPQDKKGMISDYTPPQGQVLAFSSAPGFSFQINVPSFFNAAVGFKEDITAPNVVYSLSEGDGIDVTSGQTPKISNTGVLSLGGSTGALSLAAGTGISVSGLTVTNSDLGSSQYIFKTISVSGQSDIAADSNTDTLTFAAGTGITLTNDATNDKLTITGTTPDYSLSGWTDGGTTVALSTITDYVGIGIAVPTSTLHVVGSTKLAGSVALGASTASSITFTGRIANATSILPDTDLGSDLGSTSLRFNNLWVANINSNSSQSFSGQTTFSYAPTATTITQASVLINPTTSVANGQLLGFGIAGYQRALIDAEGDMILGYSDATSAPATDYPLTIYGHSGTNVSYVDTSGNAYFAGGDLTTTATTATLFNTTATILSLGGAATTQLNLGNGSGNYTAINLGSGAGTHVINIAGTGATAADTINIGTGGTGADTINIGSSASTTALNFTSGTGAQTFASSVATGTTTTSAFVFTANALTTGTGLYLSSTSTGLTSGQLANFDWSPGSSTTATGNLFNINVGANALISGNIFNVQDNGSNLFSVNQTLITSALPHSFTAAGDVSLAYDLVFTNQTASNIKSYGPLVIESGESFESNDLTLKVYNQGSVVIDKPFSGTAVTDYGLYLSGVDSAAAANTDIGVYSSLSTSSTTAQTLIAADLVTAASGIITTGTRNLYGLRSQPASTAASTGGTTNVYGAYLKSGGVVGAGGAINSYGLYVANGTMDTTGTSVNTGLYVESPTGADTNYAAIFAGGNVGIGTTSPVALLNIHSAAGVGFPSFTLTDADVVTGLTASMYSTNSVFDFGEWSSTNGGAHLRGASSAAGTLGMAVQGIIGVTDPTDTVPALLLVGSKKNTTSEQALGDSETVLQVRNGIASSGTNLLTILGSGNVGIGTTSPVAKLHVEGQCITGDSLLSLANGSTQRIDQVKGGEQVLSLNEKTGKLEPQKIKGLLDMGVQPIYKLTTEDGKTIRTTGNHPYLVKTATKNPDTRSGLVHLTSSLTDWPDTLNGNITGGHGFVKSQNATGNANWVKVIYLQKGDLIAVSSFELSTSNFEPYVVWDKIQSIEYVGEEQVYDIEVEGTHNFVANGIIAHNTYINGNLGIGATSPSSKLDITTADLGTTQTTTSGLALVNTTAAALGAQQISPALRWSGFGWGTTAGTSQAVDFRSYVVPVQSTVPTGFLAFDSAIAGGAYSATPPFVITTGGNIGIGTTGPGEKLDITGTSGAWSTLAGIRLSDLGSNAAARNWAIYNSGGAYGNLDFYVSAAKGGSPSNATPVLSLSNGSNVTIPNGTLTVSGTGNTTIAGNVGIGTTSPSALLDVNGTAWLRGTGTSGLYVNSSGNVGIGTTGPGYKLDVSGTARFTDDVTMTTLYTANIYNSGGANMLIGTITANSLTFRTNSVNWMTIRSDGSTVFNDTGAAAADLRIEGDTNANLLFTDASADAVGINYSDLTGTTGKLLINGNVGIGTTSPSALLDVNGTAWLRGTGTSGLYVNSSGNVGIGTTSPAANLDLAAAITTGTAFKIASTNNGFTTGSLISADLTQTAATGTGVSGNIAAIAFSPTYSTAVTTPAITGNVLNIARSVTTNADFASTLTLSGALAVFSDTATQTQGTLTSTADVVQILQNYSTNTGAALNITSAGGATGFALRVNDNGTLTDTTPFVVDNAGNVGIGSTSPSYKLDVAGIIRSTGGLATYTKAGTISDTDFTETPVDGLFGFDTTNHRLYFREGGAWSYIARTAGFQIPVEEAAGLSEGDFLLPYIESRMADGALHGLYSKFSVASLSAQIAKFTAEVLDLTILGKLEAQGAVTFKAQAEFQGPAIFKALAEFIDKVIFRADVAFFGRATFNSDTAGFAVIPTKANEVNIVFDKEYAQMPIVTASPLWEVDQNTLFLMKELRTYILPKQDYIIANVTTKGFTIILEEPAVVDLKFSWTATAIEKAKTVVGNVPTPTPTATPEEPIQSPSGESVTPEVSPTPSVQPTPTATATPMVSP